MATIDGTRTLEPTGASRATSSAPPIEPGSDHRQRGPQVRSGSDAPDLAVSSRRYWRPRR